MPIHTGPDVQGAAVVTLQGECDSYDEPLFGTLLRELIARPQAVIVDFSHATFVDSVVLGTLLAVLREAKRTEVQLILYLPDHSGKEIHRVFSISGLDRILPVRRSWREAAAAATGGTVAPVDDSA